MMANPRFPRLDYEIRELIAALESGIRSLEHRRSVQHSDPVVVADIVASEVQSVIHRLHLRSLYHAAIWELEDQKDNGE